MMKISFQQNDEFEPEHREHTLGSISVVKLLKNTDKNLVYKGYNFPNHTIFVQTVYVCKQVFSYVLCQLLQMTDSELHISRRLYGCKLINKSVD